MIFWDTSALVKCYFDSESGHAHARSLLGREKDHMGSALLRPEAVSGIVRRFQTRPSRADPMLRLLESHLRHFTLFEIETGQLDVAVGLIRKHALRSGDAIHVASALKAGQELGRRAFRFATADEEQARAAKGEGLRIIEI